MTNNSKHLVPSCALLTFVPGEAVLAAASDVGHGQDAAQVSHKQQVSHAADTQDAQRK